MTDLRVHLDRNVTLENPVMVASGTFGFGNEAGQLVDVNRLGGLVTKSITLEPREGHPPPRIAETPAGMLNAIGWANLGTEAFCRDKLPYLNGLRTAVFVSVAGSSQAKYAAVVEVVEQTAPKIAGYEINISCPHVAKGGMEFGISPEQTEKLTRRLRAVTERYLIIKLSPNVTDIGVIAQAAEAGGADAVSAINTVVGMDLDPATGKFKVHAGLCGLSGPAIRPIALANVYKVAKAVSIPVIGIGGIMSVEDVVRFIRVGAWAVQVGTANYRDPRTGVDLANKLPAYLESIGATGLEKIRGTAH
ncbi:MAG: dihydroorotate dehydrogenase [Candidatus Neomarinimicrobiota bacterium]